jgi:hypothetical protein
MSALTTRSYPVLGSSYRNPVLTSINFRGGSRLRRRGSRSKRDPPAPCYVVGWPLEPTRAATSLRGRPTSSMRFPVGGTASLRPPPKRHRSPSSVTEAPSPPRTSRGQTKAPHRSRRPYHLPFSLDPSMAGCPWKELESPVRGTDSNYKRVVKHSTPNGASVLHAPLDSPGRRNPLALELRSSTLAAGSDDDGAEHALQHLPLLIQRRLVVPPGPQLLLGRGQLTE